MRYPFRLRLTNPNPTKAAALLSLENRWLASVRAGVDAIRSQPMADAATQKHLAYTAAVQPEWLSIYSNSAALSAFSLAHSAAEIRSGVIKLPQGSYRLLWPNDQHRHWILRLRLSIDRQATLRLRLCVRPGLAQVLNALTEAQRTRLDQRAAELHHQGTHWWLHLPALDK